MLLPIVALTMTSALARLTIAFPAGVVSNGRITPGYPSKCGREKSVDRVLLPIDPANPSSPLCNDRPAQRKPPPPPMQKFAYWRRAKAAQGGFKMSFLPKPGVKTVVVKRAIVLSAKPDDVADWTRRSPQPSRFRTASHSKNRPPRHWGGRCGGLGPFPVSVPRPGGAAHQSHCGRSEHG